LFFHPDPMRAKDEIISTLCNPGIIAVVRARSAEQVIPLATALLDGGVIAIEVTMTTPNAIAAIRDASAKLGKNALIGVGTVLNARTAAEAMDAGAEFVVSPVTREEIAKEANQRGRPVMLGAYTPTEAQAAYEAGADFIKIFPAEGLGPAYIKAIRAPLPHLRIVPTGGVALDNIGEWFKAGCPAVGAGSSLISPKILESNDWPELTRIAAEFVKAAKAAR
jgi:2-dehydro-3-deoxyphosphogluconate aldolase/(4S)-4-hydroxy-2-oxoglutarate aldolase